MLKNILNLNGAQKLSKNEQKEINGGICRGQVLVSCSVKTDCLDGGGAWLGANVNCGRCIYGSC
jgi:hypothetical protein